MLLVGKPDMEDWHVVRKTPSPKMDSDPDESPDIKELREKLRMLVRKRLAQKRQHAPPAESKSLPGSPRVITSKLTISLPSSPCQQEIVVVDLEGPKRPDTPPIPPVTPSKDKKKTPMTTYIRRWFCCLAPLPIHPNPPPDEPNRVSV